MMTAISSDGRCAIKSFLKNMELSQTIQCHKNEVSTPSLVHSLFNWPNEELPKMVVLLSEGTSKSEEDGNVEAKEYVKVQKKEKRSDGGLDLDVTGSPLKASFTIDNDEEDEDMEWTTVARRRKVSELKYMPLSTRKARKLVSQVNLQTYDSGVEDVPLVMALCDNSDTLYLGTEKSTEKGFALYKVEYSGSIQDSKGSLFKAIKSKHLESVRFEAKMSCTARSIYNLIDTISEEEGPNNFLQVRFCWNFPKDILEPPPSLAAHNGELLVRIEPGHEKMACYPYFKELQLLKGLAAVLNNEDIGITWPVNEDSIGDGSSFEDQLENVIDKIRRNGPKAAYRLNDQSKSSQQPRSGIGNETDVDVPISNLSGMSDRLELDFTDLLWSVLKKVTSFEQLAQSWTTILNVISREKFRPFIQSRNETKIAKMVKEIFGGKEFSTVLKDRQPLKMLVEIGLEKLRRDYSHSILTGYLASREDLVSFLSTINSSENFKEAIDNLEKLHVVQELICLCQTYLTPKNLECLRSIAQQALAALGKLEGDVKSHEFLFKINGSHINDQLKKVGPSVWQCKFSSVGSEMDMTTILHLSVEPPPDSMEIQTEKDIDETEEKDEHEVDYFLSLGTRVTRKNDKFY